MKKPIYNERIELNCSQKGLFALLERHLCLNNLDNPEGQVEVEFPLIRSYFC